MSEEEDELLLKVGRDTKGDEKLAEEDENFA